MSKLHRAASATKCRLAVIPRNPLRLMHQQVSLADLTDSQINALDRFSQAMIEENGNSGVPENRR